MLLLFIKFIYNRDREVDGFQKFVAGVDSALKTMEQTVAEQSKRVQTCYKRDAQRLGQSFYALGHAYGKDDHPSGYLLTKMFNIFNIYISLIN